MTTQTHPIRRCLATVAPGTPVSHGPLTVVPLHAPGLDSPDWVMLGEAGDAVTTTEVSDAGSVPVLRVTNAADRPLLLLDGDELIGARQNRILNTTVLVAARATATIPVSCVEQRRWSYRGRRSWASGYSLYASLRRKKAARVTQSLRERGRHESDQGEVWSELADKAAFLRVDSPTASMHDVYAQYVEDINAAREALAPSPAQTGAIVYVAGEWAGLELLAAPALFARAWPRIVSGYVADAIGREPAGALRVTPGEVIEHVMSASLDAVPPVALGVEYRVGGEHAVGAALVVEDVVAHLAAFPAVPD